MKLKHDSQGPSFEHECVDCKPQHTPTPWSVEETTTDGVWDKKNLWIIAGDEPNDRSLFHMERAGGQHPEVAQANAAFIVRAVNCHQDFIWAAKMVLSRWESGDLASAVNKLREVMEKAEGK